MQGDVRWGMRFTRLFNRVYGLTSPPPPRLLFLWFLSISLSCTQLLLVLFYYVRWSDGMQCCRSDWPGLCLFWCYQPLCVVSQQSWFWLFLCYKFSNLPPPPPSTPFLIFPSTKPDAPKTSREEVKSKTASKQSTINCGLKRTTSKADWWVLFEQEK